MSRIVIEVPSEHKALAESIQRLLSEVERVERALRVGGRASVYGQVERSIGELSAGVEAASHGVLLAALDIDAPRVLIDGKTFTQVERCPGTYRTMAGEVSVERSLYREDGQRNARVVDAVSLRAGTLGDGWLPETAQAVAHLLQQGTSREAETTCTTLGRLPYSRSSIERVGHAVGALLVDNEVTIVEELSSKLTLPEGARSLGVQVDRVSMPMEEPSPRPRGRPRKKAPKRPVSRAFRMAFCGTVTVHDEDGEVLMTLRHASMPEHGPDSMLVGMLSDVLSLRALADLPVVCLADGAAEMWGLLDRVFNLESLGIEPTRIVDFWHLVEKLSPAAKLLWPDEKQSAQAFAQWRARLLNSDGAAERILAELKQSGRENTQVGDKRPVHDAITYLTNHSGMMGYASARTQGLPIGSGPVEATCKTIVEVRMKRSGSRWKTDTGVHVLKLRALALSDRWSPAMDLVFRPLRKAVRLAA